MNSHIFGQLVSFCRCTFDEDGLEYEARIKSIDGSRCIVQFIGYENEEEKELNQLSQSQGPKARSAQRVEAKQFDVNDVPNSDNVSMKSESSTPKKAAPVLGPEMSNLMPSGMPQLVPPGDEALASMLMSWYMSGYHTGYYKAKQDLQREGK